MSLVATLIGALEHYTLDDKAINKAFMAIERKLRIQILQFSWLQEERACDIFLDVEASDDEIKSVLTLLKELFAESPVDIFVQPVENRKKKLLLSDMDSTMIEQECIDEIADTLGLKEKVAAITEQAMRGELQFDSALRERVALLKDLDQNALNDVYEKQITLMPGAKTLVQTMRHAGTTCVLVSGGFTFFTEKVAQAIGFEHHHANTLHFVDGKLDGTVVEPILGQEAKLEQLNAYKDKLGLTDKDTISIGDGANDVMMLQASALGIAYHAKPVVQEAVNGAINHNDLTAALFAQGYNHAEFKHD